MKSISISDAKATLSEQIRRVRSGEEVVILDRGHPVARLVPFEPANHDSELLELERAGLVRLNRAPLPADFWERPRPSDRDGGVREAVLAERELGW
jgi:prevent-host-death family protein